MEQGRILPIPPFSEFYKIKSSESSKMLKQSDLKSVLEYDPETGVFRWISKLANCRAKVGEVAGSRFQISISESLVYEAIYLWGKSYLSHRLAFLYMTGDWPKKTVDHIDGDGRNNRWVNLRDVSHQENMRNRKISVRNTSGYVGVGAGIGKRWRSQIGVDGSVIYLGEFDDLQEAIEARKKAEEKFGVKPARGNTAAKN
jgi:hypothetical protein